MSGRLVPPPGAVPPLVRSQLRAADGATWQLSVQHPLSRRPRAAVLCVPAMGTPARFYAPLQTELAERGLLCAVTELRGTGTSSVRAGRRVDFGYRELLTLDLPVAVEAVRRAASGAPVFLLGHSLGGQLAVLYAGLAGAGLAGIVTVAAGTVDLRAWSFPDRLLIGLGMHAAVAVAALVGHFPGRRLGFLGDQPRRVVYDWAHNGRTGRYAVVDDLDQLDQALGAVTIPVLAISLAGDRLTPPRAVDDLVARLPRAPIARRHLGAADLPAAALDHFRWVQHPRAVAGHLVGWIDAAAGHGAGVPDRQASASVCQYSLDTPLP